MPWVIVLWFSNSVVVTSGFAFPNEADCEIARAVIEARVSVEIGLHPERYNGLRLAYASCQQNPFFERGNNHDFK